MPRYVVRKGTASTSASCIAKMAVLRTPRLQVAFALRLPPMPKDAEPSGRFTRMPRPGTLGGGLYWDAYCHEWSATGKVVNC